MGLFWNGRYVLCGHVHETTGALKQIFRGIMAGFVQTCGVLFNQHTPHGQLLRGGDSLFSDATTYSEYCWHAYVYVYVATYGPLHPPKLRTSLK